MRLAYEMKYLHPVSEKTSIQMVRYSAEYQNAYKQLYNDCYHKMREELDIQPYDFIQDDSFFESGMENVYLLINNNRMIGSVKIHNAEIDDLIVNCDCQGLGYGRQILLWALEHIKTEPIVLHVAAWNKKAISLYKKTGFETVSTIQF